MVDLKAGVVRILDQNSATVGTGFLVTDDGLIATCAHVVETAAAGPGDAVRLVLHATGEERKARVEPDWWRAPTVQDVAILRLDGALPKGIVSLPLGSSAGAEGRFSTIGFPGAKPVEGTLSLLCTVIDPVPGDVADHARTVARADPQARHLSGTPTDRDVELLLPAPLS